MKYTSIFGRVGRRIYIVNTYYSQCIVYAQRLALDEIRSQFQVARLD